MQVTKPYNKFNCLHQIEFHSNLVAESFLDLKSLLPLHQSFQNLTQVMEVLVNPPWRHVISVKVWNQLHTGKSVQANDNCFMIILDAMKENVCFFGLKEVENYNESSITP